MIKEYLILQALRLHRQVKSMGGYVFLNYFVVVAIFLFLSFGFLQGKLYHYFYMLIGLQVVSMGSRTERNEWLRGIFTRGDYLRIRMIENALMALPFGILLGVAGDILNALILIVLAMLLVFAVFNQKWGMVIPTPFYRYPFEFTVGFRKGLFQMLIIGYYVFKALQHHNFYMGLFGLLSGSLICNTYFYKPEDEYFVWIHAYNARSFLWYKLRVTMLYCLVFCLPILITMAGLYPGKIALLLLVQTLGMLILSGGVMCKYSSYPNDIRISEGLLLFFSVMFPPLLIYSLPHLYRKSVGQLEGILS